MLYVLSAPLVPPMASTPGLRLRRAAHGSGTQRRTRSRAKGRTRPEPVKVTYSRSQPARQSGLVKEVVDPSLAFRGDRGALCHSAQRHRAQRRLAVAQGYGHVGHQGTTGFSWANPAPATLVLSDAPFVSVGGGAFLCQRACVRRADRRFGRTSRSLGKTHRQPGVELPRKKKV